MPITVVRFRAHGAPPAAAAPQWGVLFDRRIAVLPTEAPTTRDFIREAQHLAWAATPAQASLSLDDVALLSPVTTNQQFICQGVNYASHVQESGLRVQDFPFNTIFTKASSCLCGPHDDVVRPAHVELLDYEIELGLVLGTDLHQATTVHADRLHEVLAGLTIVNDISARDVQLPQGQFYKGKSYRTFGPVGPGLVLMRPEDWALWPTLRMKLTVNGQLRQQDLCGAMLHPPHRTLTELSGLQDLQAGDLIATGTPAGCAARAPGRLAMVAARIFISEATKWRIFTVKGRRDPNFLQPQDVMELSIRTDDGRLDLGLQRNRVVAA